MQMIRIDIEFGIDNVIKRIIERESQGVVSGRYPIEWERYPDTF